MTDSIRCDVCQHVFHQACTGLSEEMFTVLTSIISQAGWVCRQCRTQFDSLKSSLVKVNEELADMRTLMSGLVAEVNFLKNASCKQQATGCNPVMQTEHRHIANGSKSVNRQL